MSFYYLLARNLVNLVFRVFYGLKIRGVRQEDWKGVLIASNHKCSLDPLILGAAAPVEMYYFAKEEIFSWPVLGTLARKFNAFPTKRAAFDLEAIRNANRVLKGGKNLLVFIEGTRSRSQGFLPPKKGVGLLAVKNQVDIIPAYIHGNFKLRASILRFPGIVVTFGKKLPIKNFLSLNLPKNNLYQHISDEVMRQIQRLRDETCGYLQKSGDNASSEAKK